MSIVAQAKSPRDQLLSHIDAARQALLQAIEVAGREAPEINPDITAALAAVDWARGSVKHYRPKPQLRPYTTAGEAL